MLGVKLNTILVCTMYVFTFEKRTRRRAVNKMEMVANATDIQIDILYDDTLMATAKLYYLLNWDINDETIRITKARI